MHLPPQKEALNYVSKFPKERIAGMMTSHKYKKISASTEGRDPIDDIYKINAELKAYNEDIAKRPQVIAANKIDAIYSEDILPQGGRIPVQLRSRS